MDYSGFFSENALNRQPSWIGRLKGVSTNPNILYLSGGLPNATLFPFMEAKVKLRNGKEIEITPKLMDISLQYAGKEGYKELLHHVSALTQKLHSPPCWRHSKLMLTVGSQDGLAKAFVMLINKGDYVVIPEPCYAEIFSELSSLGPRYLSVEEDEEGMRADLLGAMLANLRLKTANKFFGNKPKFIYVNPTGNNPSGTTMSEKRRRQIYDLACEFDLLILEDDPYYFLGFQDEVPPSFLSLDREGRVMRFDSFSNTVSAGIRVGFVTGPKPLIEKVIEHVQATVLGVPSLSQVILSELFRTWGTDGFVRHVQDVRDLYRSRRDTMVRAAEKHLAGLCEWRVPSGGVFLWLKVPGVKDTKPMLLDRGLAKNILLAPGTFFTNQPDLPSQYMRACYSNNMSSEEMEKAFGVLADLIREEIQLNNRPRLTEAKYQ